MHEEVRQLEKHNRDVPVNEAASARKKIVKNRIQEKAVVVTRIFFDLMVEVGHLTETLESNVVCDEKLVQRHTVVEIFFSNKPLGKDTILHTKEVDYRAKKTFLYHFEQIKFALKIINILHDLSVRSQFSSVSLEYFLWE